MGTTADKAQLIEQVRQARAQWVGLLGEVGIDHMEQPGAMGDWTFRDLLAHLNAWWQREVARLEAAQRGIDRDRDGTKPRAAEIDLQELRTVRTHQRNPIARPDPGIHERLSRRGRDRRGLRKAPARLPRDKQDTIAMALGLPREDR